MLQRRFVTVFPALRVLVGACAVVGLSYELASAQNLLVGSSGLPNGIPNFCANPTISSVQSGLWSDPTTWSSPKVPSMGDRVSVTNGTVVTYDTVSDVALECVGVDGRLVFTTGTPTRMKVATVLVRESGALEIGSEAAPIPAGVTAELIIASQQTNPATDPEEFGTGLVGLGSVTMHGAAKSPTWVRVAAEPRAGDTTLTLEDPVSGWQPGDLLILPDTRHLKWNEVEDWKRKIPQWEELTLQSISGDGTVLTLSGPLTYNHLGARDQLGTLDFLPHVGNLTRNVVVRSEAPIGSGTQGHTLFTQRATVDIRFTQFTELGRTDARPTGGENQIGRYPVHFHHVMGPVAAPASGYQLTFVGNAVDGGAAEHLRRWGVTLHNTHYGLIADNVIYNYSDASLATEDGSESYNLIDHNFAVRGIGTGDRVGDGNEAQGFWFRGPNNYVRRNVAANFDNDSGMPEAAYGFKYFQTYLGTVRVPTAPGQDAAQHTLVDGNALPILEFTDNEAYGIAQGFTYWWVSALDPWPVANPQESLIKDLKIWHVYNKAVYHYPAARMTFDGLVIRGKDAATSACCSGGFHGEDYGASDIRIINSDIQGMLTGVKPSTAGTGVQTIADSYLWNDTDVSVGTMYSANGGGWLPPRRIVLSNVRHDGGSAISMHWDPAGTTGSSNTSQLDELLVYTYRGTPGDDFQVYYAEQATQNIAGGVAPCTNTRPSITGLVCSLGPVGPPSVSGVAPDYGPTSGGTSVTLTGSGFTGGATVMFGSEPATDVTVTSPAELAAVSPPHVDATVSVTVINPDGQAGALANAFTYGGCGYALSPTSATVGAGGGTNTLTVTAGPGCAWSAVSSAPWLTTTAAASGSGNASYTVALHVGSSPRTASLTIGNQTFAVTQLGTATSVGLVAAYSFDEGSGGEVGDLTGNGHGGAIAGATWANGYFGGALSFDGVDDWVTVSDSDMLDLTGPMTLEAWVYPTSLSGWRTALIKERLGGLSYALYAHDNAPRPAAWVNAGAGDLTAAGSAALALGTWTHLATTFDGATLRLYVNGAEVGAVAIGANIATSADPLRIGGNAVWGEFFEGLIDEVRVYDRALTPTELQVDMQTPVGTPAPTNAPPTLTSPGDQTNAEGDNVALLLLASDTDGDVLTYTANGLPPPLTVDGATGLISGTVVADASAAGTYSVTVSVSDGNGESVAVTFDWTITTAANQLPLLVGPDDQNHSAGDTVSLAIVATDPDGDPLTYSASGLPPELTLSTAAGSAPNAPVPSGTIVNVATEAELQAAVQSLSPNTSSLRLAGDSTASGGGEPPGQSVVAPAAAW